MLSSRWSILALLFGVRMGIGLQYQVVGTLSPLFITDFSVSVADIGLLIGLYHAPGIVLAFPGGAVGARLGDKPVALVGLALMILGELMMGLAPAWSMQIAGRFLAGSGGILLNVAMTKMITDWFAGREIATAMGIFGNASPFGIALALVTLPALAGADGRVLASCGVAAYLFVSFLALTFYRVPSYLGPAPTGQSLRPGPRASLAVLAAGGIYGLYNISLVAIIGFGPLMLTERGWTISEASSTISVVLWLVALSLPLGGWLADRTGRNSMILLGGLLSFAAVLLLSSRVDAVLPAFVLLGIVSGLPSGPIMTLPARILAPETRSAGMGLFFTIYYFMNVSGPWLIGYLTEMAGSSQIAFDLGAIFLCIGALVWIVFRQLASGLTIARN
ncbi:MAG TPA: MFS transporter [Alphaproteobacteria bacterium]|nr:MFS transporter [Alphaproteobacteria bacterium]